MFQLSHEIREPISSNRGEGIEIQDSFGKFMTAAKHPRIVYAKTAQCVEGAYGYKCWYGIFEIPPLELIPMDNGMDKRYYSEYMPPESDMFMIEVTRMLDKDWKVFKSGDPVALFETKEDAEAALAEEFSRLFCEGWTMVPGEYQTPENTSDKIDCGVNQEARKARIHDYYAKKNAAKEKKKEKKAKKAAKEAAKEDDAETVVQHTVTVIEKKPATAFDKFFEKAVPKKKKAQ